MITVDSRCFCHKCEDRTKDIYWMVGHCRNCGQGDILILIRAGDKAPKSYYGEVCPVCGGRNTVESDRLATPDEIPVA